VDRDWIPLSLACQQLGMPHQGVLRLIHQRVLIAERRGARWWVSARSLRALRRVARAQQKQTAWKQISGAGAWGHAAPQERQT
jgi:hypothetical protein